MPCKFARWCSSECKYKPNANFNSCSVRVNELKKVAEESPKKKVVKSKRQKKSEIVE